MLVDVSRRFYSLTPLLVKFYRQQTARAHLLVQSVGLCVDPPGFSIAAKSALLSSLRIAGHRITHGNAGWRRLAGTVDSGEGQVYIGRRLEAHGKPV